MTGRPDRHSAHGHLFVDEAGDPTLFSGTGKPIAGTPGCSRFFIMGKLEVAEPLALAAKLNTLREELLADPYFHAVPSFERERKKTAVAFHAKDDLPEVRYRVLRLLRQEGEGLRFHAVVRDKQALLKEEQAKRERDAGYRYRPNDVYDGLVRRLFGKLHQLADHYELWVARRGPKDRNHAIREALIHAERDFEGKFGFSRGGVDAWRIEVSDPHTTACLQAVDYFLWTLQRFYEERIEPATGKAAAREDRFLRSLLPQMAEIDDMDFGGSTGIHWTPSRPLTLEDRFGEGRKKKRP